LFFKNLEKYEADGLSVLTFIRKRDEWVLSFDDSDCTRDKNEQRKRQNKTDSRNKEFQDIATLAGLDFLPRHASILALSKGTVNPCSSPEVPIKNLLLAAQPIPGSRPHSPNPYLAVALILKETNSW
jgi:hypothetical protein